MLGLLYGWIFLISLTNALLMKRPKSGGRVDLEFMVPARDEEQRIPWLLSGLMPSGARLTVYDDHSTDRTADVVVSFEANLVSASEPLPQGWRGKTHACHKLSELATADWVCFLDADTIPSAEFVDQLHALLAITPDEVGVVTGFPKMLTSGGQESVYLFWVPFILLGTNPFGIVSRTAISHNFFLNGQVIVWRRSVLESLQPYDLVKNEVLEDVKLGRELAKRKILVDVVDFSRDLSVRMYANAKEAVDGMTKNTTDIVPGRFGGVIFALILAVIALAWMAWPPMLALLVLSAFFANRVSRFPWWVPAFVPVSLLAGSYTSLRSMIRRSRGTIQWKGRDL